MEELETLNIQNICKGSVPELFDREISAVVANVLDPNTPTDKARKITLEVIFNPFSDRSGAEVELKISTKLSGATTVKSNMFIHRSAGKDYALPQDARQQKMFGKSDGPTTTKKEEVQ